MITHPVSCEGKVSHPNPQIARRVAERIGNDAYRCKFCGLWHTGNRKTRMKAKRHRRKRRHWKNQGFNQQEQS